MMPLPKLNRTVVKIKRLKKLATVKDDEFNEPVDQLLRDEIIELSGQANLMGKSLNSREIGLGGESGKTKGWIVFLYADLLARKLVENKVEELNLKKGDTIVYVGGVGKLDLRIEEVRFESWDGVKPLLAYAEFIKNPETSASV